MTKFYDSTNLKIGQNYIEYLNDEPLWICQYIGNDVVRILKTFTGCKTSTAETYWRSQYKILTNLEKIKYL